MIIISPAKRQQSTIQRATLKPLALEKTQELIKRLSGFSSEELAKTLNVSQKIADEAWEQFQGYASDGFADKESVAAIDLYQGDVYKSLDVGSLTDSELAFLEDNLRIISAFYGVLTPMTGIWPYRLEMISKVEGLPPLAHFWQESACRMLQDEPYIFNLASNAYSETLAPLKNDRWIDIVFQSKDKMGEYRVIAVKAKRMRGHMLRYMCRNQITQPEMLMNYNEHGYQLNEALSSPTRLVFREDAP